MSGGKQRRYRDSAAERLVRKPTSLQNPLSVAVSPTVPGREGPSLRWSTLSPWLLPKGGSSRKLHRVCVPRAAFKIESTNCPRWQLEDSFSWLPSLGQPRELLKPSLTTTTRSRFVLYCNRRLLRCTTILSASVVVFPPNKMRVAPPVDYRTGTHRARGRGESTLDSCQAVNPPTLKG